MASKRKITKTKPLFGQSRSKSFNTTKRKFKPNLQSKRIWVEDLERFVRVKVTAREIKTIDKIGLREFMARQGKKLESIL